MVNMQPLPDASMLMTVYDHVHHSRQFSGIVQQKMKKIIHFRIFSTYFHVHLRGWLEGTVPVNSFEILTSVLKGQIQPPPPL